MSDNFKKYDEKLLDHEYDGIQELDNDLPPWWIGLFIFTVIWGFGYLWYYHVLGAGDLQAAEYESEMIYAQQQLKEREIARKQAELEALLNPTAKPSAVGAAGVDLEAGKSIYMANCLACHGAEGQGGIGPNLTDEYWLHGGSKTEIMKVIEVGVPAKGMISWKALLNPNQIEQVSEFIISLKGTNPPNAKAPQGDKVSG